LNRIIEFLERGDEDRRGRVFSGALLGVLLLLSLLFSLADGGESATSEAAGAGGSPRDEARPASAGRKLPCYDFSSDSVPDFEPGKRPELSEADEDAAAGLAREFALSAYGDPGDDPAAYRESLEPLVEPECFWKSQGADHIDWMEELAHGGSRELSPYADAEISPAYAIRFVLFDQTYAREFEHPETGRRYVLMLGNAVWLSEDEKGGGLVGREQDLAMARWLDGGPWKVLQAGGIFGYVSEADESYAGSVDAEARRVVEEETAELSDSERAAVEEAASDFVLAAQGYEGTDLEEYEAGVDALVTGDYLDSLGATEAEEYGINVEEGDTLNMHVAKEPVEFEITSVNNDGTIRGVASYEAWSGNDDAGSANPRYRKMLELQEGEDGWKVSWAWEAQWDEDYD
jgi:hypothetical protein